MKKKNIKCNGLGNNGLIRAPKNGANGNEHKNEVIS